MTDTPKNSRGSGPKSGRGKGLSAQPKVILFDEPFGKLDPLIRSRLQNELKNIKEKVPFTGVFVTHDMVEASF